MCWIQCLCMCGELPRLVRDLHRLSCLSVVESFHRFTKFPADSHIFMFYLGFSKFGSISGHYSGPTEINFFAAPVNWISVRGKNVYPPSYYARLRTELPCWNRILQHIKPTEKYSTGHCSERLRLFQKLVLVLPLHRYC